MSLVSDELFENPSAWTISTDSGLAVVEDKKFIATNWEGTCELNMPHELVIGETLFYRVRVDSDSQLAIISIRYGNNLGDSIWSNVSESPPNGEFVGSYVVNDLTLNKLQIWSGPFGPNTTTISGIAISNGGIPDFIPSPVTGKASIVKMNRKHIVTNSRPISRRRR